MRLRTLGYAVAAAAATFLVVTLAVTELFAAEIEFSLFLGLPAGLVAGALAGAAVLLGVGHGDDPVRGGLAAAFGAFGVVVLVVFVVGAAVANAGTVLALWAAAALGALAAAAAFLRVRRRVAERVTPTPDRSR